MIHSLQSMIANGATTDIGCGVYVRAVPLPFYGGLFDRVRDAWAVMTERAYAVRWPRPGELEEAIGDPGYMRGQSLTRTNPRSTT